MGPACGSGNRLRACPPGPSLRLMPPPRHLTLYCDWKTRQALKAGRPHMVDEVRKAFEAGGWDVSLRPDKERGQPRAPGYALVVNQTPGDLHTLNMRSAYLPNFWRIEETNDRTRFAVARRSFDPDEVDEETARAFVAARRAPVLGNRKPTAEGFIFLPLQGLLTERRSFQTMTPLQMIAETLAADPRRRVKATLHPKETYPAEVIETLHRIEADEPRFELSSRPSADLLCACDYVVTMTSGMAFHGFFAGKPAVLFGRIDFHHVAANVWAEGVSSAFDRVQGPLPPFDRYLFWFLRRQSIAGFERRTHDRIRERCRALDWPI